MQKEFPVIPHISHELSEIQETQRTQIVVKSNDIVRKGCYQLTPTQQKFLCFLIADLKDTDTAETVKEYDVNALCDFLGIPNEHNEHLKEFCDVLTAIASRRWWWIDQDKSKVLLGFLNTVRISSDNKNVLITFNPDILPYLQALKDNFTSYRIINVLDMKSAYSMRLYEILKSAEKLGQWYHDIDYLKMLLDCEKYAFGNFKQKILVPSLAEINEKSDIIVDYALYKDGRAYKGIEFYITPKDKSEKLQAEKATRENLDTVLLRNHKKEFNQQERPTTERKTK